MEYDIINVTFELFVNDFFEYYFLRTDSMTNPMYYVITIMAALGAALLLKSDFHVRLHSNRVARVYKLLLGWVVFFCLQDTAWGIISSINLDGKYNTALFVSSMIFHLSSVTMAFLWMEFAVVYSKEWVKHVFTYRYVGLGVWLFDCILLISNPWNKYVFYVDSLGIYRRGVFGAVNFVVQYLFYIAIAVLSIFAILRSKGPVRVQYRTILVFVLAPVITGVLQVWFIDMPFHTIGFFAGICVIHGYLIKREKEEIELAERDSFENVLNILTKQFDLIFEVDLDSFHEKIYRIQGEFTGDFMENIPDIDYEHRVKSYSEKYIIPACQKEFESMMEKEHVWDFVKDGKILVIRHIDNIGNEKNLWYETRIIKKENAEGFRKVIVCFRNINDEVLAEQAKNKQLKQKEENYIRQISTDSLTGFLNRMAFEDKMEELQKHRFETDFVVVSFDVNGLKDINDTMGHSAGDELLKGAANCIRQCFGTYGTLYRIGGDEFAAILKIEVQHLDTLVKDFEKTCLDWEGVRVKELSVAVGYASTEETPEAGARRIFNYADQRMYESKAIHYSEYGINRKGQQVAFNVICKSFQKILKVNLTEDSYEIIQIDQKENLEQMDYSNVLTAWISHTVESDLIHEDDKEYFLERMNMEYLRSWFKRGYTEKVFTYRKKNGDEYVKTVIELYKAPDYEDDNQKVFLYVRHVSV